MPPMPTILQSIEQLHGALRDYIEATYHISAKSLIARRQALLDRPGVIHQVPYLESTPRYETGEHFSDMAGLNLAALEAYLAISTRQDDLPRVIYDPPYRHQSEAIRGSLIDGRNLIIMTGTGSGKTESFLLPILGKLAREARSNPDSFGQRAAMRALVLYPMNALVNDQLGRLRTLFGDPRLVSLFKGWAGRPPRFARYTSRTPYAGVRTAQKDSAKLKSFDEFYVEIERGSRDADPRKQTNAKHLRQILKERGKWPAKPDLAAWLGEKGSRWQDPKTGGFARAVTLPDDTELLTRHEVQVGAPDLLVTNYSMLEYMMMRPIERSIFDMTRAFLEACPDETFLVVLDEAHLYRGAAGAEGGAPHSSSARPTRDSSIAIPGHLRHGELQRSRACSPVRRPALGPVPGQLPSDLWSPRVTAARCAGFRSRRRHPGRHRPAAILRGYEGRRTHLRCQPLTGPSREARRRPSGNSALSCPCRFPAYGPVDQCDN